MRSDAPLPDKRNHDPTASEDSASILAFVSDTYAMELRRLLARHAQVMRLADLPSLHDASNVHGDALLLEWNEAVRIFPSVHDRESTLWHAVRRAPAPALILLDLTVDPFPPLLELGLSGAAGLLLHGVHDVRPDHFAQRLLEAGRTHQVARLIPTIATLTESAPEPFRRTIASLMKNPARFETVKDLASADDCTMRTLERQYHALGIGSPRALLACARLAHLHARGLHASGSPKAVARTLGFRGASALRNAVLNISGCATLSGFFALSAQRLTQRLQAALQSKPRPDI